MARRPNQAKPKAGEKQEQFVGTDLRIIGGRLKGSVVQYLGDTTTRPMKHRVRESIFNLVTTHAEGRHVLDLFAGTGSLAFEAISRGAVSATLIERHVPASRVLQENIDYLGLSQCCKMFVTSAFLWGKRDLQMLDPECTRTKPGHDPTAIPTTDLPWLVFCSPPYRFFTEREEEVLTLMNQVFRVAPVGSLFVVESDSPFYFYLLKNPATLSTTLTDEEKNANQNTEWDVREYYPAVVGIWRSIKMKRTLSLGDKRLEDVHLMPHDEDYHPEEEA